MERNKKAKKQKAKKDKEKETSPASGRRWIYSIARFDWNIRKIWWWLLSWPSWSPSMNNRCQSNAALVKILFDTVYQETRLSLLLPPPSLLLLLPLLLPLKLLLLQECSDLVHSFRTRWSPQTQNTRTHSHIHIYNHTPIHPYKYIILYERTYE